MENVYQLDGGILKYLETCDSVHYDGTCWVFDERVTVDAALHPAPPPESVKKASSPST